MRTPVSVTTAAPAAVASLAASRAPYLSPNSVTAVTSTTMSLDLTRPAFLIGTMTDGTKQAVEQFVHGHHLGEL